jgi:hypothetical protein
MLILRWLVLLPLLGAIVCFGFFAATGEARYKRLGLVILKWTTIAALGFFAVLIVERVLAPAP